MILTVNYVDGSSASAKPTARAQCMAEEYAARNDWGDVTTVARMRFTYYLAYTCLRIAGQATGPYETWLDTVADIQAGGEENPTA